MRENILQVKHLSKKIYSKQVLDNVCFDVKRGSITGLIGPNGAGKTTTMKSILGLIRSKGEILLDGEKVNYFKHRKLNEVGSLIENPGIYPFLTGRDNLELYGSKENVNRIVALLSMGDYIDNKAKEYSLGMKQKLGIALAFVNNPTFVILDEPINALDPRAIVDVRNLIKKMNSQGITFLISSHILSELERVMTDVVILNNGRVELSQSIETLKESGKTLEEVLIDKLDRGEN